MGKIKNTPNFKWKTKANEDPYWNVRTLMWQYVINCQTSATELLNTINSEAREIILG